ncbi:MAG TPA: glycoside hydrolase family 88 protein [Anaerolineaceae bacterium]
MPNREEIKALLEKVVKRMTGISRGQMKENAPIGIVDFENWEWAQGVGLYGFYKHYQQTGNPAILAYLTGWFERKLAAGIPPRNVNTTAPMLTLAYLAEHTGNAQYLGMCSEWAEWIMREMPRTEERGFQHIVSGHENKQQLWDDTLFMTVLFLAKMGVILNRQDYLDESIRQFLVHIKYLYDKRTGLWFHGWTFLGRHNFANALWARGNCWITAGMVDYIEMIDLKGGVKDYLLDTLAAQVKTLAELQEPDGMWHTLLDDPSSYVETSATAGFGYGILKGVRKGYLDTKYQATGWRALEAVIEHIATDGTVEQVSYGTGMGYDLDHYRNIPIIPMAYGQALAALLLDEALLCA